MGMESNQEVILLGAEVRKEEEEGREGHEIQRQWRILSSLQNLQKNAVSKRMRT